MKSILVTGGAGFIGSNFIKRMLSNYPDYIVVNYDNLTYAGNLENLKSVENNSNYHFIKGDITDVAKINEVFDLYSIEMVVNFAAESHVDRSILNPSIFLSTNIAGTQVLLEAAKSHWKINPRDKHSRGYRSHVKMIQVSTDEVYGSLGRTGAFSEEMSLKPNSPYSATKASADLLVRAYHETYGLPVNITRCSNNYGPYQFPEKLIPLIINNCICEKQIPIYGDGQQIRDWLHVSDHCSAIDAVLHNGTIGEVYNIGGNNEHSNLEIVELIISTMGKSKDLISYVLDRPGHDRRYSIDNTKIKTELSWEPQYSFDTGIHETIQWYLDHIDWINRIVSGSYKDYYNEMYLLHEIV